MTSELVDGARQDDNVIARLLIYYQFIMFKVNKYEYFVAIKMEITYISKKYSCGFHMLVACILGCN